MSHRVIVSSYVIINDDCPIHFKILSRDQVEVISDQPRDGFEFIMATETLRTFIKSGTQALAELDALSAEEAMAKEAE